MTHESILLVAGEESGDRLGAMLLRELRTLAPGLDAWGIGGRHLADAGATITIPLDEVNVVGFLEVVRNYRRLRATYHRLLDTVRSSPPRFAILIDFPGFNLRLARDLAVLGVPVLYYVAPQTWAWKEGRVAAMARTISQLVVLFPFEVEYFRQHGIPTLSFGHPLVSLPDRPIRSSEPATKTPAIAYFPGSRIQELRRHLPLVRGVIERIGTRGRHLIARAASVDRALLAREVAGLPVEILDPETALGQADVALVKVGTSTLNATLHAVPLVAFYRTSWITYILARTFIKLPTVTMPNILAGEQIVQEFIQGDATVEQLASAVERLLDDSQMASVLRSRLDAVARSLYQERTVERTARYVAERFGLIPRQAGGV